MREQKNRMDTRLEDIHQAMTKIDEARTLLGSELSYTIKQLSNCRNLLFKKYAPFPVGSLVRLTKSVEKEDDNWGWHSSLHFLVRGSLARVAWIDVYEDGDLQYCLHFENDSWINDGKAILRDNKSAYGFQGDWLELVAPEKAVTGNQTGEQND